MTADRDAREDRAWHEGYEAGYHAALAAASPAPLDVDQALWDQWTMGEKLAYGVGFRRGVARAYAADHE